MPERPTMTVRAPTAVAVRWNFLVSLGWVILGVSLAGAAAWSALGPVWFEAALNSIPLAVTVGLIAWNLWASLRILGRTGRAVAALPLTMLQVLLFALLLYQIACHRGAAHYDWDRVPGLIDWAMLVLVHALRAADLVDAIEAYGLNFQAIHNHSHLTAWTLILYHLIVDLFILRLLMEGFQRWTRYLVEGRFKRLVRWGSVALVVGFISIWLYSALYWRPWQTWDLVLWPVDNVIRVVDFFDAMEIYHIRLHQVPRLPWEGTLTLVCRLIMAFAFAGLLTRAFQEFSISWLGGRGLKREELEQISKRHTDKSLVEVAHRRAVEVRQREESPAGVQWPSGLEVLSTLGPAFTLCLFVYIGSYGDAIQRLAEVATGPDEAAAQRAIVALQRMGSRGEAAVSPLQKSLPELPPSRQQAVLQTLGHLGPAAVEPLKEYLSHEDEQTRLAALQALHEVGPAAFPVLVGALASNDESLRNSARTALEALGADGIQLLLDHFTADNAVDVLEILETVDPYWHLQTSENEHLPALVRARELLPRLGEAKTESQVQEAVDDLIRIGPSGREFAVSILRRFLQSDNTATQLVAARTFVTLDAAGSDVIAVLIETASSLDPKPQQEATELLAEIGEQAIKKLVEQLSDAGPDVQQRAVEILVQMGEPVIERVIGLLSGADAGVQQRAVEILVQMGEPVVERVSELLSGEDSGVQELAVEVLEKIGTPAAFKVLQQLGISAVETNSIGMKLVLIPAGEFMRWMDAPEVGYNKRTQHRVRISKPFYLGVTEVTQEQYERVMGKNPSHFKGDSQRPVEGVSLEDAVEFCRKLGGREGWTYRLPTEVEWEYACQAGSTTRWCFGDSESELEKYAWYYYFGNTTHAVGQKLPNAWGLYDMYGNVWEWCATPHGVSRGGCWSSEFCETASRYDSQPERRFDGLGFRVALVLADEGK